MICSPLQIVAQFTPVAGALPCTPNEQNLTKFYTADAELGPDTLVSSLRECRGV